jgi:hypothetical protein
LTSRKLTRPTTIIIVLAGLIGPFVSNLRSASPPPSAESRRVPTGVWGGAHIRMVVNNEGARLEYDCASGAIDEPIVLDRTGRFNVTGSHTSEHGGPRREGQSAVARARYTGRIRGNTMTLTVALENPRQRVGVFTLTRNNDALLTKCR